MNETTQPSCKHSSITPGTKFTNSIGVDYSNVENSGLEAISEFKPSFKQRRFYQEAYDKRTPSDAIQKREKEYQRKRFRQLNYTAQPLKTPKHFARKKVLNIRHDVSTRESMQKPKEIINMDSTQLVCKHGPSRCSEYS